MKVGRNELCPCGSGKKYKKCCWEKEENEKKIIRESDSLYASIKKYNYALLKKANVPLYVGATFDDAMDFCVTCNALSLIKNKCKKNLYSITAALNMRSVIECYALKFMDEAGDITEVQKELFLHQYKLIEYESYASEKKGLKEKYSGLLNFDDLTLRYKHGRAKFLQVVSESKLKRLVKTRAPFLCQADINFNALIKKYCEDLYDDYSFLSCEVHPSSYSLPKDKARYDGIYLKIKKLLTKSYDKPEYAGEMKFFEEERYLLGVDNPYKTVNGYLFDLLNRQKEILEGIASCWESVGGRNYACSFFKELAVVVQDINSDNIMGYHENAKLKFKVLAEMFACFNKIYFDYSKDFNDDYSYEMLKLYDEYNKNPLATDIPDVAYKAYKNYYPQSKLNKDEFEKKFKGALGFFTDEDGMVPTYSGLAEEYFNAFAGDEKLENNDKVFVRDFLNMLYRESNNTSHGCGYLFFANKGAWGDDGNVIAFLDNSITAVLDQLKMTTLHALGNAKFIPVVSRILSAAEEMKTIIGEKVRVVSENTKIPKDF